MQGGASWGPVGLTHLFLLYSLTEGVEHVGESECLDPEKSPNIYF